MTRAMSGPEWVALIFLSVLWGGSFFFNGLALREWPVLWVVAARVALAAAILLVLLRGRMPTGARIWGAFALMGFLNNVVPFTLIVAGQQHIASGLASILNAATPLFTVLLAHALTEDERLTPSRLAGVLTGFAGVAVMIGGAALSGMGQQIGPQLMVLAAAFSYALAGIYGRRFRGMGVTPVQGATGQLCASAVMLLSLALLVDGWPPMPSALTALAIGGLAALSTALAYVIYFRLLATAGASNLLLVTLLIPVSAIWLGWAVLNEALAPRHFAGMALIGLGLLMLDGRLLGHITRRTA